MTPDEHAFVVLGDLRGTIDGCGGPRVERGLFVVRMFVGDNVFDEEVEATVADLPATVNARMLELEQTPEQALLVDAERPVVHPGHAVAL